MGKMFSGLKTDGVEKQEDRLGGFAPLASGIYDGTIKTAYAGKSPAGAQSVTLVIGIGSTEYRETIYITNTKGENFYADKQDPKKKILSQGYSTIDDICLFTTEEPLAEQETETKVVKAWNSAERKEMNTEVPMLVGLIGKPIKLAILQTKEWKQVKQGDVYVDSTDIRLSNSIDKTFHPETGRTVNEYMHETETADFLAAWSAKNNGVTRDKTRGGSAGSAAGAAAGTSGTGSPLGGQKKSLFGNK